MARKTNNEKYQFIGKIQWLGNLDSTLHNSKSEQHLIISTFVKLYYVSDKVFMKCSFVLRLNDNNVDDFISDGIEFQTEMPKNATVNFP